MHKRNWQCFPLSDLLKACEFNDVGVLILMCENICMKKLEKII